jgi:hypothetical protein
VPVDASVTCVVASGVPAGATCSPYNATTRTYTVYNAGQFNSGTITIQFSALAFAFSSTGLSSSFQIQTTQGTI